MRDPALDGEGPQGEADVSRGGHVHAVPRHVGDGGAADENPASDLSFRCQTLERAGELLHVEVTGRVDFEP